MLVYKLFTIMLISRGDLWFSKMINQMWKSREKIVGAFTFSRCETQWFLSVIWFYLFWFFLIIAKFFNIYFILLFYVFCSHALSFPQVIPTSLSRNCWFWQTSPIHGFSMSLEMSLNLFDSQKNSFLWKTLPFKWSIIF